MHHPHFFKSKLNIEQPPFSKWSRFSTDNDHQKKKNWKKKQTYSHLNLYYFLSLTTQFMHANFDCIFHLLFDKINFDTDTQSRHVMVEILDPWPT